MSLLEPTLHELRSRDVDVDALLRSVRVDPAELQDPTARIPIEWVFDIGIAARDVTDDPAFGLHLAEAYQRHTFGTLDYLAHNNRTLGDANNTLLRFYELLQDAIETHVERADGRVTVFNVVPDSLNVDPGILENSIANMVVIGRELTGRLLIPIEVTFRHQKPDYASEHRRIFRCPVKFDAPRDGITWPESVLDVEIREPDLWLSRVLERHALSMLKAMPKQQLVTHRVCARLAEELSHGAPDLKRVARSLGMSERTLRRRLDQEGTNWGVVLDDFRRALAERHLANPDLRYEEVAHALGYATTGAFRRAFRRWHDQSPSAYRKGLLGHG